jgi:hypothetical protein
VLLLQSLNKMTDNSLISRVERRELSALTRGIQRRWGWTERQPLEALGRNQGDGEDDGWAEPPAPYELGAVVWTAQPRAATGSGDAKA